ncbi:UNVERIFIED_CONTAM: hypothetical protein Sindi_2505300 [Sesamum indicum]
MGVVISKQLLLLSLLFLVCFISTTTTRVPARNVRRILQSPNPANERGKESMVVVTEEEAGDAQELAAMDYTPARKKSPIHN